MSLAGFKPTIPASVRLQTYNLDRVTTGISHLIFKVLKKSSQSKLQDFQKVRREIIGLHMEY